MSVNSIFLHVEKKPIMILLLFDNKELCNGFICGLAEHVLVDASGDFEDLKQEKYSYDKYLISYKWNLSTYWST